VIEAPQDVFDSVSWPLQLRLDADLIRAAHPAVALRATTKPIAPNCRFEKTSDAATSTSTVRARTVVTPLINAPIR
jgi:hypothetical protein